MEIVVVCVRLIRSSPRVLDTVRYGLVAGARHRSTDLTQSVPSVWLHPWHLVERNCPQWRSWCYFRVKGKDRKEIEAGNILVFMSSKSSQEKKDDAEWLRVFAGGVFWHVHFFFFFLVKGLDKPNISAKRAGCEQSGSHVILLMSGKQPYFHWQQNGKRRWLVPLTSPCRTCRQLARSRIAHMPVFAILLLLKCLENFGSEKVTSLFTVLLQGNWW